MRQYPQLAYRHNLEFSGDQHMYIFNEYLISTKAGRENLLLDQAKLLIIKTLHCKELRFAKPTK